MTRNRKATGLHTNGAVVVADVPEEPRDISPDLLPKSSDIKLPPKTLTLTEDDREILGAYNGQQDAILRGIEIQVNIQANQELAPVRSLIAARLRKIEARLGLPAESLGTTHGYDVATGIVTPKDGS